MLVVMLVVMLKAEARCDFQVTRSDWLCFVRKQSAAFQIFFLFHAFLFKCKNFALFFHPFLSHTYLKRFTSPPPFLLFIFPLNNHKHIIHPSF
jgi:hypothetical protein